MGLDIYLWVYFMSSPGIRLCGLCATVGIWVTKRDPTSSVSTWQHERSRITYMHASGEVHQPTSLGLVNLNASRRIARGEEGASR